ncbi:MAG: hypothetical protein AAFQ02_10825 [Bacteroidota bacterium]
MAKRKSKKQRQLEKKNKAQEKSFIMWTVIITAALLVVTYLAFSAQA